MTSTVDMRQSCMGLNVVQQFSLLEQCAALSSSRRYHLRLLNGAAGAPGAGQETSPCLSCLLRLSKSWTATQRPGSAAG